LRVLDFLIENKDEKSRKIHCDNVVRKSLLSTFYDTSGEIIAFFGGLALFPIGIGARKRDELSDGNEKENNTGPWI